MPQHLSVAHNIEVDAPVDRTFRYFTPAGEELWVEGWRPRYIHPADGRTEAGMVFTTGEQGELTIWTLADFDPLRHRSRYLRCTPASRTGMVEVACESADAGRTRVRVRYTLTALNPAGERELQAFEGEGFAAMIDAWAARIRALREVLATAVIR